MIISQGGGRILRLDSAVHYTEHRLVLLMGLPGPRTLPETLRGWYASPGFQTGREISSSVSNLTLLSSALDNRPVFYRECFASCTENPVFCKMLPFAKQKLFIQKHFLVNANDDEEKYWSFHSPVGAKKSHIYCPVF